MSVGTGRSLRTSFLHTLQPSVRLKSHPLKTEHIETKAEFKVRILELSHNPITLTNSPFQFCPGVVLTKPFLENATLHTPFPAAPALGSTLTCQNQLLIQFLRVRLGTRPAGTQNHWIVSAAGRDPPLGGPAVSQMGEPMWNRMSWHEL